MPARPIRPVVRIGSEAYVVLTKNRVAVIDAEDIALVAGYNWCARQKTRTVYAVRTDYSGEKQSTVALHSHILPPRDGYVVDHIDGDGLNNRRSNLRYATVAENRRNSRAAKRNKSGFKGVRASPTGRWWAAITWDGKRQHLGTFDTAEEAAEAYRDAAKRLHGEFARF
jgi:hypothetical protein